MDSLDKFLSRLDMDHPSSVRPVYGETPHISGEEERNASVAEIAQDIRRRKKLGTPDDSGLSVSRILHKLAVLSPSQQWLGLVSSPVTGPFVNLSLQFRGEYTYLAQPTSEDDFDDKTLESKEFTIRPGSVFLARCAHSEPRHDERVEIRTFVTVSVHLHAGDTRLYAVQMGVTTKEGTALYEDRIQLIPVDQVVFVLPWAGSARALPLAHESKKGASVLAVGSELRVRDPHSAYIVVGIEQYEDAQEQDGSGPLSANRPIWAVCMSLSSDDDSLTKRLSEDHVPQIVRFTFDHGVLHTGMSLYAWGSNLELDADLFANRGEPSLSLHTPFRVVSQANMTPNGVNVPKEHVLSSDQVRGRSSRTSARSGEQLFAGVGVQVSLRMGFSERYSEMLSSDATTEGEDIAEFERPVSKVYRDEELSIPQVYKADDNLFAEGLVKVSSAEEYIPRGAAMFVIPLDRDLGMSSVSIRYPLQFKPTNVRVPIMYGENDYNVTSPELTGEVFAGTAICAKTPLDLWNAIIAERVRAELRLLAELFEDTQLIFDLDEDALGTMKRAFFVLRVYRYVQGVEQRIREGCAHADSVVSDIVRWFAEKDAYRQEYLPPDLRQVWASITDGGKVQGVRSDTSTTVLHVILPDERGDSSVMNPHNLRIAFVTVTSAQVVRFCATTAVPGVRPGHVHSADDWVKSIQLASATIRPLGGSVQRARTALQGIYGPGFYDTPPVSTHSRDQSRSVQDAPKGGPPSLPPPDDPSLHLEEGGFNTREEDEEEGENESDGLQDEQYESVVFLGREFKDVRGHGDAFPPDVCWFLEPAPPSKSDGSSEHRFRVTANHPLSVMIREVVRVNRREDFSLSPETAVGAFQKLGATIARVVALLDDLSRSNPMSEEVADLVMSIVRCPHTYLLLGFGGMCPPSMCFDRAPPSTTREQDDGEESDATAETESTQATEAPDHAGEMKDNPFWMAKVWKNGAWRVNKVRVLEGDRDTWSGKIKVLNSMIRGALWRYNAVRESGGSGMKGLAYTILSLLEATGGVVLAGEGVQQRVVRMWQCTYTHQDGVDDSFLNAVSTCHPGYIRGGFCSNMRPPWLSMSQLQAIIPMSKDVSYGPVVEVDTRYVQWSSHVSETHSAPIYVSPEHDKSNFESIDAALVVQPGASPTVYIASVPRGKTHLGDQQKGALSAVFEQLYDDPDNTKDRVLRVPRVHESPGKVDFNAPPSSQLSVYKYAMTEAATHIEFSVVNPDHCPLDGINVPVVALFLPDEGVSVERALTGMGVTHMKRAHAVHYSGAEQSISTLYATVPRQQLIQDVMGMSDLSKQTGIPDDTLGARWYGGATEISVLDPPRDVIWTHSLSSKTPRSVVPVFLDSVVNVYNLWSSFVSPLSHTGRYPPFKRAVAPFLGLSPPPVPYEGISFEWFRGRDRMGRPVAVIPTSFKSNGVALVRYLCSTSVDNPGIKLALSRKSTPWDVVLSLDGLFSWIRPDNADITGMINFETRLEKEEADRALEKAASHSSMRHVDRLISEFARRELGADDSGAQSDHWKCYPDGDHIREALHQESGMEGRVIAPSGVLSRSRPYTWASSHTPILCPHTLSVVDDLAFIRTEFRSDELSEAIVREAHGYRPIFDANTQSGALLFANGTAKSFSLSSQRTTHVSKLCFSTTLEKEERVTMYATYDEKNHSIRTGTMYVSNDEGVVFEEHELENGGAIETALHEIVPDHRRVLYMSFLPRATETNRDDGPGDFSFGQDTLIVVTDTLTYAVMVDEDDGITEMSLLHARVLEMSGPGAPKKHVFGEANNIPIYRSILSEKVPGQGYHRYAIGYTTEDGKAVCMTFSRVIRQDPETGRVETQWEHATKRTVDASVKEDQDGSIQRVPWEYVLPIEKEGTSRQGFLLVPGEGYSASVLLEPCNSANRVMAQRSGDWIKDARLLSFHADSGKELRIDASLFSAAATWKASQKTIEFLAVENTMPSARSASHSHKSHSDPGSQPWLRTVKVQLLATRKMEITTHSLSVSLDDKDTRAVMSAGVWAQTWFSGSLAAPQWNQAFRILCTGSRSPSAQWSVAQIEMFPAIELIHATQFINQGAVCGAPLDPLASTWISNDQRVFETTRNQVLQLLDLHGHLPSVISILSRASEQERTDADLGDLMRKTQPPTKRAALLVQRRHGSVHSAGVLVERLRSQAGITNYQWVFAYHTQTKHPSSMLNVRGIRSRNPSEELFEDAVSVVVPRVRFVVPRSLPSQRETSIHKIVKGYGWLAGPWEDHGLHHTVPNIDTIPLLHDMPTSQYTPIGQDMSPAEIRGMYTATRALPESLRAMFLYLSTVKGQIRYLNSASWEEALTMEESRIVRIFHPNRENAALTRRDMFHIFVRALVGTRDSSFTLTAPTRAYGVTWLSKGTVNHAPQQGIDPGLVVFRPSGWDLSGFLDSQTPAEGDDTQLTLKTICVQFPQGVRIIPYQDPVQGMLFIVCPDQGIVRLYSGQTFSQVSERELKFQFCSSERSADSVQQHVLLGHPPYQDATQARIHVHILAGMLIHGSSHVPPPTRRAYNKTKKLLTMLNGPGHLGEVNAAHEASIYIQKGVAPRVSPEKVVRVIKDMNHASKTRLCHQHELSVQIDGQTMSEEQERTLSDAEDEPQGTEENLRKRAKM